MEYEVPCDWNIIKRQAHSTFAARNSDNEDHKRKNKKRMIHENIMKTYKKQQKKHRSEEFAVEKNSCIQDDPVATQCEVKEVSENLDIQDCKGLISHPLGNKTMLQNNVIKQNEHNQYQEPTRFQNAIPKTMGFIRDLILKQFQTLLMDNAKEDDDSCQVLDTAKQHETNCVLQEQRQISNLYVDTDSLIAKLPYKKMLSDMFGGNLRGHLSTSDIPYVTRAYEESFMHEPLNSQERECAKGKMCECMFIDKSQPFVCVEFLLPGEQPPRTPNMCVLCYRAITQQLYYDVIFDKCEFPGIIQKFGNIHSEVGEYSLDSMLIAAPTAPAHIMPLPIVSHQRNRYSVYISSGIKRLKQSKVYFQNTPSCNQNHGQ